MRKIIFLFIFLVFCLGNIAQDKKLKTLKIYSLSSTYSNTGKKIVYKVDGKNVDRKEYDKAIKKYELSNRRIDKCTPCILKSYNLNNELIFESENYYDCLIGLYKEYYKNGNLKLKGYHKGNKTNIYDNLTDREICDIPNGKWTYYNLKGDTLYNEFWEDGIFIKQIPEQDSIEIWAISLELNNQKIEYQAIDKNQIKDIKLNVKYKNSNQFNNLFVEIEISAIGHKDFRKKIQYSLLKKFDINQFLDEAKMTENSNPFFKLTFFDNDKVIYHRYLKNIK